LVKLTRVSFETSPVTIVTRALRASSFRLTRRSDGLVLTSVRTVSVRPVSAMVTVPAGNAMAAEQAPTGTVTESLRPETVKVNWPVTLLSPATLQISR